MTRTSFRHSPAPTAHGPRRVRLAILALLLACGGAAHEAQAQTGSASGQLRMAWLDAERQAQSPMAQAVQWQPALGERWAEPQALAHLEGKGELRWGRSTWSGRAHAQAQRHDREVRLDELYASVDAGAWQLSAGRKLVAWDVGHAFRPNDTVAKEPRRPLLSLGAPGRPLLQAEWFGAETALSLVWVNPAPRPQATGVEEQALASRWYWRQGSTDWHVFARHGHRSQGSLGLAFSSVPADAWELHGSWRWQSPSPGQSAHHQALLGGTWTHSSHVSVLMEAWWDGAARSPGRWQAWQQSVAQLQAGQGQPLPGSPQAGAMAGKWMGLMQAFNAENLRRQNLLLRLSWDASPWSVSVDALLHPEDGGHSVGASMSWQGDRWRLEASWRQVGGPSDSALARVQLRQQAQISTVWSF